MRLLGNVRAASLSVLMLAAPLAISAQTPADMEAIDKTVAAAMDAFHVPGVALAIVKDGKVVAAKGYGFRDVDKKLPITPSTLFPIASITKSFTVTALGTLVDKGQLDWDKPVKDYLPTFRMHDSIATDQLTTRDMVTHRTGMPRHDLVWYSSSFSRADLIARLRYLELNKPIRSTFQYNNLMFLTAGYLGGHIAGTSWEDIVTKGVLAPLDMKNTMFSFDEARKTADYALPYRKDRLTDKTSRIEFTRWGDVGPAGSMASSIEDMSRYLLMHLGKGSAGGKTILGRNNAEQMQKPQMVTQGSPDFPELGESSYGMGLFIESYRGHKHIEHGGNLDGYSLNLSFLPNDGIGVIVLTNLDGTPVRDLLPYVIYDRLLGLSPIDWTGRFLDIEKKGVEQEKSAGKQGMTGRKSGTKPSQDLASFTGEFQHPGYGRLAIRQEAGRLLMKLNDVERPLDHFHYDTFVVPDNPLDPFEKFRITFVTNSDGDIDSVESVAEARVKAIRFERVAESRMTETSFLRPFTGEYDAPGAPWTISLLGETALQWSTPGSPPRKLRPRRGTRFDVEGLTGISLEFQADGSQVVLYTPDGINAVPRKK